VERGLTVLGVLVLGQSRGSFRTNGGAVSNTGYIAKGAYTFEMTNGDRIC
jgi:hypothetical protein